MSVLESDPIVARRAEIRNAAHGSLHRRRLSSAIVSWLCGIALLVAVVLLFAVLTFTVARGYHAWSGAFFTHLPTPAGVPGGGISNAIVGSAIIDGMAALIALPVGVLVGLFLARSTGRFGGVLRFGTEVFSGVPSIAIGIFAYTIIVLPTKHFSAIAASVALAILMLPVVARASEASIRTVPIELVEGGQALGAREGTVARRILLPAALPGIVTGGLLAISRAIGESAPLLFTTIASQSFTLSPSKPMAALPLVVYGDGLQPYPDLQQIAWGAALFLVAAALLLNITSRLTAARLRKGSA
ncbi:MAG: phosphate ABC transporter permease PstA [Actinomycetota bacterium]